MPYRRGPARCQAEPKLVLVTLVALVTLVELVQREGLEGTLYQALGLEVGAVSFFYIYPSPCGIERVWALVAEQGKAGVRLAKYIPAY